MPQGAKVPAIRFKGFSDDWEQRKVGELGNIITGSTPPTNNQANYGGQYLFVSPADIQGARYVENTITTLSEKGFRMSRILKEGSVLFVSIGSTIGKVAQTKGLATTNQQINAIEANDVLDKDFIFSLMENKAKLIKGLAATQAVPIVNKTSFSEVDTYIPANPKEQSQIGEFFKHLDNLITLHQRKLLKLKNVKKAMLEKMFPKDGSKVPEIRFAGFTDDWEQSTIGEMCEIVAGGTPSTSNEEYWNPGLIPWLSSGEVHKKRITYTDNMISHEGLFNSSAKWVKANSVLIALAGQGKTRGTVAINNIPLTTNQSVAAMVPTDELSYEYLFQNLESRYEEMRMISSADGSRGGLNKQMVSDIIIRLPKMKEQSKIGTYFLNLDNLITLQQQKLEKLKNIKKACLEKMFI